VGIPNSRPFEPQDRRINTYRPSKTLTLNLAHFQGSIEVKRST
jgi:hypothetical protein